MKPEQDAGTRERILFYLKTRGAHTATRLAGLVDLTPVAVRQHLTQLEDESLVERGESRDEDDASEARRGAGRPAVRWSLTSAGDARFPEGYAELALDMLANVREAFGKDGLDRLVAARTKQQLAAYRDALPGAEVALAKRVAALAKIRSREGYMAEWRRSRDGSLTLIENHCPICAAAQVCQGICAGELELFRRLLSDATVERTEHILEGARRCAYRIVAKRSR